MRIEDNPTGQHLDFIKLHPETQSPQEKHNSRNKTSIRVVNTQGETPNSKLLADINANRVSEADSYAETASNKICKHCGRLKEKHYPNIFDEPTWCYRNCGVDEFEPQETGK